ncbi:MAG: minor capsid protein [candidate division Zixibacteria bacterium]|nr:minor capsid protein [Candidatus Tariuqbacter arcticus]
MSLVSRRSLTGGYRKSFEDVVNEWADMGVPSYSELSHAERLKLAVDAFSLVDRKALDFLVNYELQLLGNVSRELAEGIKNQITIGLIQGESVAKISKNIGGIITDPEEFRRAGKTVFKTAQLRTDTIVRTETLRAYNQGRYKFYKEVGVTWVIWMSVGDKRMCLVCGELDSNRYRLDKAPRVPRHTSCRCSFYADRESLGLKEKNTYRGIGLFAVLYG